MADPIVYVDRSGIRAGRADELERAVGGLAAQVDAQERRVVSYGIYFSEDRSTMTVVHLHPDSASLEQLMDMIEPMLPPFRDLLRLQSIDVYGKPSRSVLAQLERKADLLGGTVSVHELMAQVLGAELAVAS